MTEKKLYDSEGPFYTRADADEFVRSEVYDPDGTRTRVDEIAPSVFVIAWPNDTIDPGSLLTAADVLAMIASDGDR